MCQQPLSMWLATLSFADRWSERGGALHGVLQFLVPLQCSSVCAKKWSSFFVVVVVPRHCNLCVFVLWIKKRITVVRSPRLVVQICTDRSSLGNIHWRKQQKNCLGAAHLFHCRSDLLSPSGSLCCRVQKQIGKVDFLMQLTLLLCAVERILEKEKLMQCTHLVPAVPTLDTKCTPPCLEKFTSHKKNHAVHLPI